MALVVTLPLYLTSATAIPWSWHLELDLPVWELFLASTHAAAFALMVLMATIWLSIRIPVQAHVAASIGAFLVLQIGIYLTQRIRPTACSGWSTSTGTARS